MTRQEFLYLYEKSLRGACSASEEEQLAFYQDEMKLSSGSWDDPDTTEQEVYDRIRNKLLKSRYPGQLPKKYFLFMPSRAILTKAAAAILIFGTALWIFKKPAKPQPEHITIAKKHTPVLPGGNKAYLTLADGSKIILNDARIGKLATQAGIQVTKAKDGMLIYRFKDKLRTIPAGSPDNTITTPPGGQYQLVLSDGTKVWLNAASSLKFPAHFLKGKREVELTGEAYFEVHKNAASPFVVKAADQQVLVLGTHFNIKAYQDENTVKTSLLEGRVNISLAGQTATLRPGQEAVNRHNGQIGVHEADVEESIAWKKGLFQFNNAGIEEVMRQIARWYNVKVSYTGQLPVRQFTGTVSRQVSIGEILNMLRYTGIQFQIHNDHIIVGK
jgi:transmembrane sensor